MLGRASRFFLDFLSSQVREPTSIELKKIATSICDTEPENNFDINILLRLSLEKNTRPTLPIEIWSKILLMVASEQRWDDIASLRLVNKTFNNIVCSQPTLKFFHRTYLTKSYPETFVDLFQELYQNEQTLHVAIQWCQPISMLTEAFSNTAEQNLQDMNVFQNNILQMFYLSLVIDKTFCENHVSKELMAFLLKAPNKFHERYQTIEQTNCKFLPLLPLIKLLAEKVNQLNTNLSHQIRAQELEEITVVDAAECANKIRTIKKTFVRC